MAKIPQGVEVAGDAVFAFMPFVNGVLGLIVVCYILSRLFGHADQYTYWERAGMSTLAGGMLLATPALWIPDTPFDGWSFNVARAGIVIYIITGGMRRDRHARKNAQMVQRAIEDRRKGQRRNDGN